MLHISFLNLRVVIVLFRAKLLSAKLCNSLRNVIALLIGFGGGYLIQFSNISAQELIDFNTQIRPILSSNCFACHGPDESERAADLRLDYAEGAIRDLGGYSAIVPGNAEASELMKRVVSEDEDLHMPPLGKGASLTESQVLLLRSWIEQGANYSVHWAYVPPAAPRIPSVTHPEWVKNKIDYFILRSIEDAKLEPSPLADRLTLARRLSIDLTGLPPTWDEAVSFRDDSSPEAYEKFVDFLLDKPSFGERWARVWLDLSRYADSAGYADDPERTIWAFRDYVIRSLNANKSFDQFTIEQIAGDLLPNPTTDQLIATAFHRNTLTNNEGGTNDEEFRNVAVVDRVNTTMAVWMGTTMACAQCHTHKYDPITQKEYFELFAFFNNSRDADRRDEQPLHEVWNEEQLQQKKQLENERAQVLSQLGTMTPEIEIALQDWVAELRNEPHWDLLNPDGVNSQNRDSHVGDDGWIHFANSEIENDSISLSFPIDPMKISGLKLEVSAKQERNFVLSDLQARWEPNVNQSVEAQFVRVELPGKQKMIHLAEIELYRGNVNVALEGTASQSSTDFGGNVSFVNDGNTDGAFNNRSVSHTAVSEDPWVEIDLGKSTEVDRLVLWNRTDGDSSIQNRLSGYRVSLLSSDRELVWSQSPESVPAPSKEFSIDGSVALDFVAAFANHEQDGFPASSLLKAEPSPDTGWAVGPFLGTTHEVTLILKKPRSFGQGKLVLQLNHDSKHKKHLINHLRISESSASNLSDWAVLPENVRASLLRSGSIVDEAGMRIIHDYFLTITPLLQQERDRLDLIDKQLAALKPYTTVPIMRELEVGKERVTRVQVRGNYLNTAEEVTRGVPAIFHEINHPENPSRLDLAMWLIDKKNPLTARVIVNRHWEQLFGRGLVTSSEEFGSQGDLPTHPELLDWLAIELMENDWDLKFLIKAMVMSATYQQSSVETEQTRKSDPDNQYYTRGPRFRASAEVIRDQALAVSGLLSNKMFGPPVNPPQPQLGLRAAFGSGTDWNTSAGEDRYRRGIYTAWRRSSPYPSMAQFDAPNREVCTVRRIRTNTPLQALVTLNDPVYIEAAQSFARKLISQSDVRKTRIENAFQSALTRLPKPQEIVRIEQLLDVATAEYQQDREAALQMATNPLGELPQGFDVVEAAAWTIVANVILNLDEILMKR